MEELKSAIEIYQAHLPVLSTFWEVKALPGVSSSLLSVHYNTSKFKSYTAHKVLSTSVDFSILLAK
jgi:hypothetical protein